MEKPMMFDSTDVLLEALKAQMEEMEANKEKYEAEAEKRKATVEAIIEALHGYSWGDAEELLKAAEFEIKQRFKVIASENCECCVHEAACK